MAKMIAFNVHEMTYQGLVHQQQLHVGTAHPKSPTQYQEQCTEGTCCIPVRIGSDERACSLGER